MTELDLKDAQDERGQLDALEDLSIGDLRKVAKHLGIASQRDWTKEDYVNVIKHKQEQAAHKYVFDTNLNPAPGFARIIVHRDPTPGHKNNPIHSSVNGRIYQIPRGIQVDVPLPIVEALQNAIVIVTRQSQGESLDNPMGVYVEEEQLSYPFQVISFTPGEYKNKNDARSANYERRYAFFCKFGRWPTAGELAEAMKIKMRRELADGDY
jgi:hypothetical protein